MPLFYSYKLFFIVRPVVQISPINGSIVVGGNRTFSCGSTTSPGQITWQKLGSNQLPSNVFQDSNNNLVITSSTQQDTGEYLCNITNSFGSNIAITFINIISKYIIIRNIRNISYYVSA